MQRQPGQSGFVSYTVRDPDDVSQIEARLSTGGGATFPFLLGTVSGDAPLISFTVPSVPFGRD